MIIGSIRVMILSSWMSATLLLTPTLATASDGGSVNLVATLKDAPAFTPIEWKVLRVDNASAAPVATGHSHSLNLPLKPGTYKAVASYHDVTRDRTFTVGSNGQVNVVIAMD